VSNAAPRTQADLIQLFEPVRDDLLAVEREFAEQVQSQIHIIPEIGNYLQMSGGKRVRPAVLLMAARLSGYSGPRAITNAAVVEFIHTATLVHDDIIDDADVRRGRKSAHAQWGNDVTVLAGDFLYIKSMAMALTQDTLDVVRLLCDVTLRMIEGELYQLTKNGVVDLSENEHFDIIHRKTAYLFGGCAQIGGILGGIKLGTGHAARTVNDQHGVCTHTRRVIYRRRLGDGEGGNVVIVNMKVKGARHILDRRTQHKPLLIHDLRPRDD